jgi:hypothetical protein
MIAIERQGLWRFAIGSVENFFDRAYARSFRFRLCGQSGQLNEGIRRILLRQLAYLSGDLIWRACLASACFKSSISAFPFRLVVSTLEGLGCMSVKIQLKRFMNYFNGLTGTKVFCPTRAQRPDEMSFVPFCPKPS